MSDDPTRAPLPSEPAAPVDPAAELEAVDDGPISLERLSDYLDAGREPYDPEIEADPSALAQLAALTRLRSLTAGLLAEDAAAEPAPDPSWIAGVMSRVRLESRTGREIPLSSPDPRSRLHVTEGAVRSLIREAGDSVPGSVVISCGIVGDVSEPDAVVSVEVAISALFGTTVPVVAEAVRAAVAGHLAAQTELVVEAVDVTVRDVHLLDTDGGL
jgi:hypothetical protein